MKDKDRSSLLSSQQEILYSTGSRNKHLQLFYPTEFKMWEPALDSEQSDTKWGLKEIKGIRETVE